MAISFAQDQGDNHSPDALLPVSAVAQVIGKSPDAIYRNRERWGLPLFFVGGRLMADPKDLITWINDKKAEGAWVGR